MNRTSTPRSLHRLGALAIAGVLTLIGLNLGGCSSANQGLLEGTRALQDRNTQLAQQNESLVRANQELQRALAERDGRINEFSQRITDIQGGSSNLQAELDKIRGQIPAFGPIPSIALDPQTDELLKQLAAQYPDILEYDAQRGLLRFKSDLTFDSGSDTVKSSARPSLAAFARILNGSAAQYDVRIVGHTDAQRLSAATAARHTSNIRLSADRAISVRGVLAGEGVDRARIEVAGRGEFDPMVPNNANGNTAQNRRVEIFLVKPTGTRLPVNPAPEGTLPPRGSAPARSSPSAPASTPTAAPAAPAAEEIMK